MTRIRHNLQTRQATEMDTQYIFDAHMYGNEDALDTMPHSIDTYDQIQKCIANPDWRQYIVAMAGTAIVGAAYVIETPIPAVGKRGQYIDMMRVSEGHRCHEIEQRLIGRAAAIAIENAPDRSSERSFLRMDSLSQTTNVAVRNLRLRGDELTAAAQMLRQE
ncbi:hypothetical protein HY312_01030 [Candidatus Saccharibacteria bacterium]|nr:hypothetical protein [Candidatus Saccharibacteria bacterium]